VRAVTGYLGIVVACGAAALGIATLGAGLARRDPRLLVAGRRFVFFVLAGAVVAVAAMEWALLSHDFSIRYVADNVARATPTLYTVTALWGALEGSILLWGLVLAIYLVVTVVRFRARATDPVVAWATLTALAVALFFFGLMAFVESVNPFHLVEGRTPLDGAGPNPLLQNHPLMAFHPPLLYAGYVGFTVPFAFAVAALATGRFGEGWLADVRRSTLVAWGFLTVGIVLGAWWSYEVLGWGGYWAWDPVENASLLPWLTGTAFVHSVMVQERRGMLRVWNLALVLATFCLTILGTFLTRSGVIGSVHAFSESEIGHWLLAFLALVAATGIALVAWRGDALRAPGRIDSPLSRESAFLANNLLFASFAFVVLLGTVFPLVVEALQDRQLSVGEPYFDRMATPIGLALLFLMAVAPALPWRAATGEVVRRRLVVPAWVGGATMAVAVALGADGVANVLTFGLGAFAAAAIARQVLLGVAAHRRAHRVALPGALAGTVRGNPRLYGGLVVHAGVVLVAVALAASSGYTTRAEVRLADGESAAVGGYEVTYLGTERVVTEQKSTVRADVQVARGGDVLGVYQPSISSFPNFTGGIGTPSVRTGLLEDVYLTLVATPADDGRATIGVAVNPLVLWLWIGGGVMALGTVLALLPRRRAAPRERARDLAATAEAATDEPVATTAAREPVETGVP
jgi:cytochrome c-type biogenesis protein CcmF